MQNNDKNSLKSAQYNWSKSNQNNYGDLLRTNGVFTEGNRMRELEEIELQRETKMRLDGVTRYNARSEKQKTLSKSNTHHSFITDALPKVAEGITSYIEEQSNGRAGRPYGWATTLKNLCPQELAYIGLNSFMDTVGQRGTLTTCTSKIAKRIELQVWSEELKTYDKSLYTRVEKIAVREYQTDRKRVEAVRSMVAKHSIGADKPFTPTTIDVAIKSFAEPVVNAVLEFSNVFEIYCEFKANKTKKMVGLTPEAAKEITTSDELAALNDPMFSPMVCAPIPWDGLYTGGYISQKLSTQVPLVRGSCYEQRQHVKRDFQKAGETGGLPAYVEALNALQAVPLKINNAVLDLVQHCWENKESFKKFPLKHQIDLPQSPSQDEWATMDVSQQTIVRSERINIIKKNREIVGRAVMMEQDLQTSSELSEYDEYFLVWNMDFRGRFYPVSNFSYHRDDHIKAMTLLKNGSRVTSENCEWLAIHVANCGDFNKISKQTLDDRVLWVEFNEQLIRDVAEDPIANLGTIKDADKPFQFYAACVEWVGYLNDPENYITCLPPSLDGSCSGCQHYSALSLNNSDGALVNLVPSELPADVYQTVADRVLEKMKTIALASHVEPHLKPIKDKEGKVIMTAKQVRERRMKGALMWLDHGITRATVKRNTMTYPYSSNEYGFSDQIKEDLMNPLADKELMTKKAHPFGNTDQQFHATKLFAELSYKSVQEVIASAAHGMKFLQSLSVALAKEDKPTHWRSPINFPVVQKYTKWRTKKVRLFLYDREAKVKVRAQMSVQREDKAKIDTAKSKSGVAANFVHSLDSAHLASTILTLVDNRITDFMVIHDSFAVGVENTWELFDTVRATFIDQYQGVCLYDDFLKTAEADLADPEETDLQPIPEKGTLNLLSVMESDYCFS